MFERWKVNFGAIRVQMRAYVARMLMRQLTPAYDLSPPEMQNLLGRAIDSLQRATTKYPRCMLALLRHAAGMICFMCDPEWNQFLYDAKPGYSSIEEETGVLFRPSRQYKSISLSEETCTAMWDGCQAFAKAARIAMEDLLQCPLAKQIASPLPDVTAFFTKSSLCEWARESIALQPFPEVKQVFPKQTLPVLPRDAASISTSSSG
ncbi:unnamed protein product, partial [Polarella glacialis]